MSRRLIDGKLPTKPMKTNAGRPLALNQELLEEIVAAIRLGAPPETAFAYRGISYTTMRNWVLEGHEHPESLCGELISRINRAVSEFELRHIAVIETHAQGRPTQYMMQPVRDADGRVLMGPDGKPLMEISRDGDGKPIVKSESIRSDWKASMEILGRRRSKLWARRDQLSIAADPDAPLTFDNTDRQNKAQEALTFEQKIARAVKELEDEV